MTPGIELDIDRSALKALSDLEKRLQAKVLRKALTDIAKPIRKDVRESAPSDTGGLKKSISYKTVIDRKNQSAATFIGLNYKKSNRKGYVAGVMQEGGTKYMKAQPFIEPVEKSLDIADIESDMAAFIQLQIDSI